MAKKLKSKKVKKSEVDSDEQLVVKVTSGDKELYAELVQRYQAKLVRYVTNILNGNDAAAQDVVQETFIKAFVNLRSFKVDRKFSSWIYRIAHNEAMNYIKKHKREVQHDDEEWEGKLVDERPTQVDDVEKMFNNNSVKKSLAKLDLKYREPLMLYIYYGNSYEEISEILKMPRATVGVRISRAKDRLKVILKQEGISYD